MLRILLILVIGLFSFHAEAAKNNTMLTGINLAGAEFGADKLPGVVNQDYIYPTPAVINAYADFGMNVIRVPFRWERMQPELGKLLNPDELKRLDDVVMAADARKVTVILDPHNYGHYRDTLIGDKKVPSKAFAHFWSQMARHYRNQGNIVFGLMNEPNKHTATDWAKIAKEAIQAIRKEGAKQLILVPGTLYSGAHSWHKKAGKKSNAEALAKLRDPRNNMMIEFHHYFDYNYSGTHEDCTPPEVTEAALEPVTKWLKKTKNRGFLGEFGISKTPACLDAMQGALEHLKKNSGVWGGWTYWAASEWFGNYAFNVYPVNPDTYPQLNILHKFLNKK